MPWVFDDALIVLVCDFSGFVSCLLCADASPGPSLGWPARPLASEAAQAGRERGLFLLERSQTLARGWRVGIEQLDATVA